MLGPRTVRRSLRTCAPRFVKPLTSRDEDDIKILECHVDGYPRPDIRWEKDGKPVGKSRRIHMVRSGDMCLLQIRMPQEEDFGQYSCIASNIMGTTVTHIRLGTTSESPTKSLRSSSPQTLKAAKISGLRSRSMDRDFIEENKNMCSQRSRSRSASRNSKQDLSNSTKSKFSSFKNNISKRSDVHSSQKFDIVSAKKQGLSKSVEDCRKVRKGFFDKVKIPDIFIQKDETNVENENVERTDVVLPIIDVSVANEKNFTEIKVNGKSSPILLKKRLLNSESLKIRTPKNEPLKNGSLKKISPQDTLLKNGFPRSESLKNEILKNKDSKESSTKVSENHDQSKPRGKFASYLKIFENTNSVLRLKKPQVDRTGSLKIPKEEKNKEKTSCGQVESEGFLARLIRRKSPAGERKSPAGEGKSPEIIETTNFVSQVSADFLINAEQIADTKQENGEHDKNDSLNKNVESNVDNGDVEEIKKSDDEASQNAQELSDIINAHDDKDGLVKECAKIKSSGNTDSLEARDICLSDSTNSHSTEEITILELTPPTENAEVFITEESVPNKDNQKVPSESDQKHTSMDLDYRRIKKKTSKLGLKKRRWYSKSRAPSKFVWFFSKIFHIPEEEVLEIPKDVEEETSVKEEMSNDGRNVEDSNISVEKHCEGTISYSQPLNDEKCEDLLKVVTQEDLLESDFQRVSSPIESPARIIKGPQSVTVLRGESVTLAISFTGVPVPNVIWMKGGRVLRCCEDGRLSILEGREMSVVTVNEVTADDSGKYVVCVENEGGGDSRFASVAVVGFPEPPGGEPTASEFTDHSLVLSWYGSMYDGGSVVTGYQVEMCTLPDTKWHKVASSVNTSCSVQGLSMGQRYVFRVRAENRYGVSHPSKESKIICLNDYLKYDTSSDEEPEDVPENAVTIENGTLFTERFDLKEEVGKGRFGTVYRCVEFSSGRARAAKIIRCLKMKDKEKVRQEIEIMSRLHHPKLMQVLAAFESGKNMIMVMEFISGGELFERVIADDFVLTEHDCILFMRQICDGVAYMHRNNILHLDLKPENILCKTRTSHKIKIIDFGLAREYNSSDNLRILFGTPEFVAPEVLNYEPVSPASDMWSVGVICYVLLSGLSPFMGDNDTETFANITRAEMDFDDDAFDEISQDAKDFISSLLVKKIKGRMSAEECLKHPWLATARLIQKRPLSTEKLKRFIIRRKWQKSGTAIRALGRMVSLSRSSLGSSCESYSPMGSPTSSRSRTSLASRSETADSGDSEVFSR